MYKDSAKLGLVFFPAFDWQISATHPERVERLLYTRDQLEEEGLLDLPAIREYNPMMATMSDVERVHVGAPSLDKWVTDAHLVSAGGCIAALEAVMRKEVERAFALVRPPGHHAMRMVHGIRGFCTINVEAVMLAYLRRHYGNLRVAVIDTDVHHGDGSEDVFYHDPDTLYISFHQDGRTLYPGTGFIPTFGGPQAIGSNVNIPLPPGTGDEGLHLVLDELILPILEEWKPDLIINSAGQDNHFTDPLANMKVTARGYAKMAEKLKANVAVLEGGYAVQDALPYVNTAIVLAMADMDYSQVVEPAFSEDEVRQSQTVTRQVEAVIREVQEQWKRKEEIQCQVLAETGDVWHRQRSIFYDESGVYEKQLEKIPLYRDSLGYHQIISRSQGSPYGTQEVGAVIIPRQASNKCKKEGRDAALRLKKEGIRRVVLLDESEGGQEEL